MILTSTLEHVVEADLSTSRTLELLLVIDAFPGIEASAALVLHDGARNAMVLVEVGAGRHQAEVASGHPLGLVHKLLGTRAGLSYGTVGPAPAIGIGRYAVVAPRTS